MVEVNPPAFEDACYSAPQWRKILNSVVCEEGVADFSAGDLLVTAVGGGSLNVSVAAGHAWVKGDLNGGEGVYEIENDAAVVKTIAANAVGSARIDLIIASVYDSHYVGASDTWSIDVVQGTAGAGIPAVPASTRVGYIVLGQVTVPASGGTPSVVTDVRRPMTTCGANPYISLYAAGPVPLGTSGVYVTMPVTDTASTTGLSYDPTFFSVSGGVVTILQDGVYVANGALGIETNGISTGAQMEITSSVSTIAYAIGESATGQHLFVAHMYAARRFMGAGTTVLLKGKQDSGTSGGHLQDGTLSIEKVL